MVNEMYTHEKKRTMNGMRNEARNWEVGGGNWAFFGRYRGNKNRCEVMYKPDVTYDSFLRNVFRGMDVVPRID
jgi:hypothetical protein